MLNIFHQERGITNMDKSNRALRLIRILKNANKSVFEPLKQNMTTYNLNPTEFMVLEFLFSKGTQSVQKIAEKVELTSGSMTYIINRLFDKGLIVKQKCAKDNRICYISLSERGKELFESIFPTHVQFATNLIEVLTDEEIDVLSELLKKLGLGIQEQHKGEQQ